MLLKPEKITDGKDAGKFRAPVYMPTFTPAMSEHRFTDAFSCIAFMQLITNKGKADFKKFTFDMPDTPKQKGKSESLKMLRGRFAKK